MSLPFNRLEFSPLLAPDGWNDAAKDSEVPTAPTTPVSAQCGGTLVARPGRHARSLRWSGPALLSPDFNPPSGNPTRLGVRNDESTTRRGRGAKGAAVPQQSGSGNGEPHIPCIRKSSAHSSVDLIQPWRKVPRAHRVPSPRASIRRAWNPKASNFTDKPDVG